MARDLGPRSRFGRVLGWVGLVRLSVGLGTQPKPPVIGREGSGFFGTTQPNGHSTLIKHRIVEFIEFFFEDRRMRWSEIIHHLDLICSSNTLARFLRDLEFRRYRAVSKSWLTDKQKMNRLNWALKHQSWNLTDWQRVIWTDEFAIHVDDSQHIFVTRQIEKNRMISDCFRSKFQRSYYCMIWEIITTD